MASITCTKCGATLKTSKPVAAGKKLKCPKCEKLFVVEDEEEPEEKEMAAAEEETPEEEEEVETPKNKRKQQDDEEDTDSAGEDDEDERPKKKDKKKKKGKAKQGVPVMLLIGGGAALLLLLLVGGGVGGWYFFLRKPDGAKTEGMAQKKGADADKKRVGGGVDKEKDKTEYLVLDIVAFRNEFKDAQSGKAAMVKYNGKMVEVTGKIRDFSINAFEKEGVNLDPVAGSILGSFQVESKVKEPWALAAHGQTVKMRGKVMVIDVKGQFYMPRVVNGEFVGVEKNEAPLIKSTDLTADFDKYKDKSVIVAGDLVRADAQGFIYLKGNGGLLVECQSYGGLNDPIWKAGAGTQVKIIGVVKGQQKSETGEEQVLRLDHSMPIWGK